MKAQRYEIDTADSREACMVCDDCGCYVLHEDYAKLRERFRELEAELRVYDSQDDNI